MSFPACQSIKHLPYHYKCALHLDKRNFSFNLFFLIWPYEIFLKIFQSFSFLKKGQWFSMCSFSFFLFSNTFQGFYSDLIINCFLSSVSNLRYDLYPTSCYILGLAVTTCPHLLCLKEDKITLLNRLTSPTFCTYLIKL